VHGLFADVVRRQSERLVPNLRTPARAHVRWPVYIPRKSSRAEAVTVRSAAKNGLLDLKLRLPHGLDGRCDATNPEQFFAGA
jgi:hypothetical protein